MKKTLFAAFFACALTLGAFTASAADGDQPSKVDLNETKQDNVVVNYNFSSKVSEPLRIIAVSKEDIKLKDNLASAAARDGATFGYKVNGTEFVPLKQAMENAQVVQAGEGEMASIHLGTFSKDDKFQFGYQADDGSSFHPVFFTVSSDPGFYAGYNPDSFYVNDFAEDPFDGQIEIMVVGEPLPTSTVTILVALGAAAAFLLYKKRRELRVAGQA